MAKRVWADTLRQVHKYAVDDMMKARQTWSQIQRDAANQMRQAAMIQMQKRTDNTREAIDHVKKALLDGSVTTEDIELFEVVSRVMKMLETCPHTGAGYPKEIVDQAIAEVEIDKMIESE